MKYVKLLYEYIDVFLNFIYPRNIYCILCSASIDRDEEYSICYECKRKLKFIYGKTCEKCGKPLNDLYLINKCNDCVDNTYFFTKAVSCLEYDDLSKKIIYDLKYHKKRYISYHIAEIIYDRLKEENISCFDIIIPVPLHEAKERERSFNQAYLIGKYISKMTEIEVDNKALLRVKNTVTQNKLTKEERMTNLEGAFKVVNKDNINHKNILLVDDVFTTGATVNRCSKILLENGAKRVYVATLATGRNM
ncbi:ComF family protein [Paramaledivibacter caminithermalis]|jgi:ComF family protein|uniref:ComF family protein n=1 Tax=Paramaledivibacter caminithermalis (strain DSM 15212 / CIP 107654 / DViRD3) TaxID=1121301 RepID=A0A1M6L5K5_PARC5|nr:ComF family protein [Paramaledivibacter caminithermalis]SHJ66309.1 comF family protein [Paramaledivibacter caminithermalis DSM 15212]